MTPQDLHIPSPLQKFTLPNCPLEMYWKRDDLIHPKISGNKWRKIHLNLKQYEKLGSFGIISFGGAFSNHLYALAHACEALQIECVGIIRGERKLPLNHTLQACENAGMRLLFIDREEYQKKEKSKEVIKLLNQADYFIIPEGGNNTFGSQGMKQLTEEIYPLLGTSKICWHTSVGSGTTLKGIYNFKKSSDIICAYVMVQDQNVIEQANAMTGVELKYPSSQWKRFAKFTKELGDYINDFFTRTGIWLDPVYTAKMMHTFEANISQHNEEYVHVLLHTGGLQGIYGYNQRMKQKDSKILWGGYGSKA